MTPLQQRLGLALPILQAPMAGSQGSALAIAVGQAGGLGALPGAMLGATALQAELRAMAAAGQPVNVNFFCHRLPPPEPAREAAWREALAPYFTEWGVDPDAAPPPPLRAPFSAEAADVLDAFRPAVVSFHFGLPPPELLARVRAWGSTVLATATTVDEARWLAANGADAVIAQGLEAGGHRGHFLRIDDLTTQLGSIALVPQMVRAVDVPVIAAGGFADARGVAAAMALGASAVQVGTAYLLCPEATTSEVHRAALQADAAAHTALTRLFSGGAARGIVNRLMRELGPMHPATPPFPLASAALSSLRAAAERQGVGDFSPLWAGQNVSGCRTVPAARITRDLANC